MFITESKEFGREYSRNKEPQKQETRHCQEGYILRREGGRSEGGRRERGKEKGREGGGREGGRERGGNEETT